MASGAGAEEQAAIPGPKRAPSIPTTATDTTCTSQLALQGWEAHRNAKSRSRVVSNEPRVLELLPACICPTEGAGRKPLRGRCSVSC